ncbi:MAG: hypothetical protein M3367_02910 [Acidobacteriota bacterium]|nr:hypothetical protein [Acidobacteriota bacterium]
MPRTTNTQINALLVASKTESTVDIVCRTGQAFKFSSGRYLAIANGEYLRQVLNVSDLNVNVGVPLNRISVTLGNVPGNTAGNWGMGATFPLSLLDLADITVRVFLEDIDTGAYQHPHYFNGKCVKADSSEQVVVLDVVDDITAAGTRFAVETLSPNKGWIFPGAVQQSPPGGGLNEGGIGSGTITEGGGTTREHTYAPYQN